MFNTSKDSLVGNALRKLRLPPSFETETLGQNGRRGMKESCGTQRELKRPERVATPLFFLSRERSSPSHIINCTPRIAFAELKPQEEPLDYMNAAPEKSR